VDKRWDFLLSAVRSVTGQMAAGMSA